MSTDREFRARVVRLDARGCLVRLDEALEGLPDDGRSLWCSVRGRIHLLDRKGQKSPVAVGDRVRVVRSAPDRGAVVAVEPRRSMLSRPAGKGGRLEHVMVANVDRVVIVASADDPPFTPGLVDRILAVVAYSDLEAQLVVNKIDLVDGPPAEVSVYEALGYPVLLTSALRGDGIEALREQLGGGASVVCGHSGVGKSSLLNAVRPELGLVVGDVNPVTRRGTHTTTAAVWIPFGEDGAVIDTAGVREFGLFGIPKRDLPWLFRDLAAVGPGCRFPDCIHVREPDCAVQSAVEAGEIAAFRYESYLRILESLDQGGT
ncbi:MAG: ribosome small subunit-dependent GTPase A [Planctomycetota bacterium]|jgi:ribosome biogenesis GTPase